MIDDLLLIVEELVELHNETAALPTSCKHVLERQPNSPSGFYILAGATGTYSTYCNMGTLCGSVGGWTRIGYLDMSDATQNCPSGLRYFSSGSIRACGSNNLHRGGCSVSVRYPSNGISYTQICGRITAYQFGHTDAIDGPNNINANYLEGVSITPGSPRQHVWSFLSSYNEATTQCPCSTGSSYSTRSFMGNNYFCESGNPNSGWSRSLYTADPLWDGQGCRSTETPCCNINGLPWFHRDYGSTSSTESLELRMCSGDVYYENSPISYLEFYIK